MLLPSSSVFCWPHVIVPRQTLDTIRSELPSFTSSMLEHNRASQRVENNTLPKNMLMKKSNKCTNAIRIPTSGRKHRYKWSEKMIKWKGDNQEEGW